MPSGKPLGTTWRPIEAATTPWVPILKLFGNRAFKDLTTLTVRIASNLSANIRQPSGFLRQPMNKPSITNEFSYRSPSSGTLPWQRRIAVFPILSRL
ncbi:MAG: hypothetical protein JWO19_4137 [Bryobacterales bacterium]|nr:hypothetical protein [Bryobacterales bacterium]